MSPAVHIYDKLPVHIYVKQAVHIYAFCPVHIYAFWAVYIYAKRRVHIYAKLPVHIYVKNRVHIYAKRAVYIYARPTKPIAEPGTPGSTMRLSPHHQIGGPWRNGSTKHVSCQFVKCAAHSTVYPAGQNTT